VAQAIVLLGEDEAQSGILTVKDFASGVQSKVARGELAGVLASR
jgi:histidyl-tRNA synthetase